MPQWPRCSSVLRGYKGPPPESTLSTPATSGTPAVAKSNLRSECVGSDRDRSGVLVLLALSGVVEEDVLLVEDISHEVEERWKSLRVI